VKTKKLIYLDNAATAFPPPAVISAVADSMKRFSANPAAPYALSGEARGEIRRVKTLLADIIGATPQEIYFTSGGTESNNWAVRQAAGQAVTVSAIEHKSVLLAAENQGCSVSLIKPTSGGIITPESVKAAIRPETALISVMLVNNETGVTQPIEEIGKICKEHKVLFHCDAVAAFGHIPIDVKKLGVSVLSVSAHKIGGPRGIGFLYVKQGIPIKPLIAGGDNEKRGGTENVAAVSGFGAAAEIAAAETESEYERLRVLREIFRKRLKTAEQTVSTDDSYPGIISIRLTGIDSEIAIAKLDLEGVMVSGGAACNSSSGKPSGVLLSMGMSERAAKEVIRISMGRDTTESDITAAADIINKITEVRL
jgi:cysteine desulfurase